VRIGRVMVGRWCRCCLALTESEGRDFPPNVRRRGIKAGPARLLSAQVGVSRLDCSVVFAAFSAFFQRALSAAEANGQRLYQHLERPPPAHHFISPFWSLALLRLAVPSIFTSFYPQTQQLLEPATSSITTSFRHSTPTCATSSAPLPWSFLIRPQLPPIRLNSHSSTSYESRSTTTFEHTFHQRRQPPTHPYTYTGLAIEAPARTKYTPSKPVARCSPVPPSASPPGRPSVLPPSSPR
jgi:hypothetical protein